VTAVQTYSVIATVFGVFTGIVFTIHATPIPVEIGSLFVTVLFFALTYRLWLKNNHKRKKTYNWGFVGIIVLDLAGCSGVWLLEEPPKPHLTLVMTVAGERGKPLLLTNDFLQFPVTFGKPFIASDKEIKGFVIVPILETATNIGICFGLGATPNKLTDIDFTAAYPTNQHPSFDSEYWRDQVIGDQSASRITHSVDVLTPVRGSLFKPINFDTDVEPIPIIINVTSPDIQPSRCEFILAFLKVSGFSSILSLPKPIVLNRPRDWMSVPRSFALETNGESREARLVEQKPTWQSNSAVYIGPGGMWSFMFTNGQYFDVRGDSNALLKALQTLKR
jgi:hypothetical protein